MITNSASQVITHFDITFPVQLVMQKEELNFSCLQYIAKMQVLQEW